MEEWLIAWVIAGRRPEAEAVGGGGWVLRETRRAVALRVLLGLVGLCFAVILAGVAPSSRDPWIMRAIAGSLVLGIALWVHEGRRYWLRVDDDGLSERRPFDWARPRRVAWDHLRVSVGWFRVIFTDPSGGQIELHRNATLDGLETLLEQLLARLPAQRAVLREAAHFLGVPPAAEDPAAEWLQGVPRLYPGLSGLALASFLTPSAAKQLAALPTVLVHPFADPADDEVSQRLGAAVSRMVIRDLMLLRDLSVRGPEDTPSYTLAALDAGAPPPRSANVVVVGRARLEGDRARVDLLVRRGDEVLRAVVDEVATTSHAACASEVARLLGVEVDEKARRRWDALRPRRIDSLLRHGALVLGAPDDHGGFDAERDHATLLHDLEVDRETRLRALELDPFDAQLCFHAFLAVWSGTGPQDCALQFLRKALELSPGLGKAHMCLPHVARAPLTLLHHSELGRRLLPGNVFGVTNYLNHLRDAGRGGAELLPLAEEAVCLDPEDPFARGHAIELLRELGDDRAALVHAGSCSSSMVHP